jgi:hypothetical protein
MHDGDHSGPAVSVSASMAFDQARHNEGVHGENKFQSHGFVVLTPRMIMTIMAIAAIKRAHRPSSRHGMPSHMAQR